MNEGESQASGAPTTRAPGRARVRHTRESGFPDPFAMRAGEPLLVSDRVDRWEENRAWIWVWSTDPRGRSGWVPRRLIDERDGQALAREDYAAVELSVAAGEEVRVQRAESGWLWCEAANGRAGWVPASQVAPLDAASAHVLDTRAVVPAPDASDANACDAAAPRDEER